jgi:hypothetical protein
MSEVSHSSVFDTGIDDLPLDHPDIVAIVANGRSEGFFSSLFGGRHWVGILRRDDAWYDLDSKLDAPRRFRSADQLRQHLKKFALDRDGQILLVKPNGA